MRKFVSFGYKIDYDKEIAEDEKNIAHYDSPIMRAISQSLTREEEASIKSGQRFEADIWLWYSERLLPERARILGLSQEDVEILASQMAEDWPDWVEKNPWVAALAEEGEGARRAEGPTYHAASGSFRSPRVREILGPLENMDVLTEDHRVALLKKAKTSLSRHKRNKEKFES